MTWLLSSISARTEIRPVNGISPKYALTVPADM